MACFYKKLKNKMDSGPGSCSKHDIQIAQLVYSTSKRVFTSACNQYLLC